MPRYTNRQQLLSTRTVADIAKQVHEAETPKLIHRLYLFGQYDPEDNLWEDLDPIGGVYPSLIDWQINAKIVDVCQLLKSDTATIPLAALMPADNPLTARDELQQAAFDLPNMLTAQFPLSGKRSSNSIKIHALSALVRLSVFRNEESTTMYTDKVTFRFGFYKWTKITATGLLDNQLPNIKSIVKWAPVGFSKLLDSQPPNVVNSPQGQGMPYAVIDNIAMLMNSEKLQVLVEKEITIPVSAFNGSVKEKTIRIYKELDIEPLQYSASNVTGEDTTNYKIYFAIRADTPNYITGDIEPRCFACVKNYYTNIL